MFLESKTSWIIRFLLVASGRCRTFPTYTADLVKYRIHSMVNSNLTRFTTIDLKLPHPLILIEERRVNRRVDPAFLATRPTTVAVPPGANRGATPSSASPAASTCHRRKHHRSRAIRQIRRETRAQDTARAYPRYNKSSIPQSVCKS